jgi:predicted Rossmann fold nucleotide-binding protein DprA/Smf involved in DNA uptake
MDESILAPIAILNTDLTAVEWAERLKVPLEDVMEATRRLGIHVKPEPRANPKRVASRNCAVDVLNAVRDGQLKVKTIAATTGLMPQTVRAKLNQLAHAGLVHRMRSGQDFCWLAGGGL